MVAEFTLRHMKLKHLLYSQVLEEGSRGPYGRGSQGEGSAKQMGAKKRRTCGQVPLLGVRVEYTAKDVRDFFGALNVARS